MNEGTQFVSDSLVRSSGPSTGTSLESAKQKFQNIDLDQPLTTISGTLEELRQIYADDTIYFHQPTYVAHLNCPVVYPALLAESIISSINTSVDTWDQSIGATLIEQAVINWTAKEIGFSSEADGVFTSGGTQSNLMGMLLARDHYAKRHLNHDVSTQGLPEQFTKFRIFTSEVSHFSVQKSAAILGLGHQSVISVPVDSNLRMRARELKRLIQQSIDEGEHPIAVVATAGTTDFGSVDPISSIAEVCRTHGIWLHTDAAYGCGLLASEKHRHLLNGIELSDSVTVDYHKSFFQPVSCSAFFVKDHNTLSPATHHADYLNPLSDKNAGIPNSVNKSLQTTRRFDALKMWLTLRIMGKKTIGQYFEKAMSNAQIGYKAIKNEADLDIIHKPEISTLVFRFKPPHVKDELLDDINKNIRQEIYKSGQAMVAGTKFRGRNYLKFTLLNPETQPEDIAFVLKQIQRIGWMLLTKQKIDMRHS
ncbi:MAG: aspartate aminotransferase family protein [Pseudobacteriovorax sp.]|nr:aspartate aminotransferase family protein [Pseudobacteriovorax sp.]